MAAKQLNYKSEVFKSGFNELTMVDYPIYNLNYDEMKHSIA